MKEKSIYRSEVGKKAIMEFYDSHLSNWPIPYEGLNINTRCGNTFIIACGEKHLPPLLLIHGSSTNSMMWTADMIEYSRQYRVYAIDIPGEPGKSNPYRPELKNDDYEQWLLDIYNELGLTNASVVGISLGAFIAIKFAVFKPVMIKNLVVLCPSGIVHENKAIVFKLVFLSLMGKWGMDRLNKLICGDIEIHEDVIKFNKLIAKTIVQRVESIPIFSDEELKRLTMPVLFMSGENDPLLRTGDTAERLKRICPYIKINILPNTAHVVINVTDKIMEFFRING